MFLIAVSASSMMAVAIQPPGQIPIVEPLRPIEPGNQPNYSNNVQDDEQTPANIPSSENLQEPEPNAENNDQSEKQEEISNVSGQKSSESNNSKKWVILAVLILVLICVLGWIFRKKIMKSTALILAGLFFAGSILCSNHVSANVLMAQSNERNNTQPIQRTIEEENKQGFTPTQVKAEEKIAAKSRSSVVFGLGSVILLIVGIGAAAFLLKNNIKK